MLSGSTESRPTGKGVFSSRLVGRDSVEPGNRLRRTPRPSAETLHRNYAFDWRGSRCARPIIALNKYRNVDEEPPEVELVRTPRAKKQLQVDRLKKFKQRNAAKAKKTLEKLAAVAETRENCFPALLDAVEVCSLGQISGRLQEIVGRFRPMV